VSRMAGTDLRQQHVDTREAQDRYTYPADFRCKCIFQGEDRWEKRKSGNMVQVIDVWLKAKVGNSS
jgi:hypothetical protein